MASFGNKRRCLTSFALLFAFSFGCSGPIFYVFGIDVLSRM